MPTYFFSHTCDYFPFQVLGGIEPSLYKGDIWYTPIKEEWYYQIEILKLEIGGQSLNLDCREVPNLCCARLSGGAWVTHLLQLGPEYEIGTYKINQRFMTFKVTGPFGMKV